MAIRSVIKGFEFGLNVTISSAFESALRGLKLVGRLIAEDRKREEVSKLLLLDDWQLKDMGISRDDVKSALAQPMSVNSGNRLQSARSRK